MNNSIEELTADAFQELNYLEYLEMSHERTLNISTLKMSFRSLNKLRMKYMIFKNNAWQSVPIDFFSDFKNYTMKKILLNGNIFRSLNGSLLSYFSRIQTLNISRNELVFLNASGLNAVEDLTLSDNNIFDIPSFCADGAGQSLVPTLTRLDLTDNVICKLLSTSFHCLDNLNHLILDKNRIIVLQNDIFTGNPSNKFEKIFGLAGCIICLL